MRCLPWVWLILGVAGCAVRGGLADSQTGCGALGCVGSQYLAARGGPTLIGRSVDEAVAAMGGPPTSSSAAAQNGSALTWTREQHDPTLGYLSCTETITASGGRVVDYAAQGNCARP